MEYAALASIAGSLISSYFNQSTAEDTSNANAYQAQVNREFQERMRSTQYQTAVADMKAAGLNPMLAYHLGGAGTPAGSAAQAVQPHPFDSNIGSSAVEAAKAWEDIKLKQQEQNIKKPVEKISESAEKGIDAVKDLVKPISESVSDAVRAVEDKIRDGSLTSATADRVEKVVEGAKSLASDIAGKILTPYKAVGEATNSAYQAASRRATNAIHGEKGIKVPESKGKIPREAQGRIRRNEWQFNYSPQ